MGARLRRSGKAGAVAFMIAIALIGSAWLAFATTAPTGPSNGYGTTTTTMKSTTTTMKSTTTTTMKQCPPHKPPKDHGHDDDKSFMTGGKDHHDDGCPPPCKPENDKGHQGNMLKFLLSFGFFGQHHDGDNGPHCPPPPPPCKPGYGFGDKNHCHSGPPGKGNH